MGNCWGAGLSPEHHGIYGILVTRWAYIRDFLHCPLACAWGSRRPWMAWKGHQLFRSCFIPLGIPVCLCLIFLSLSRLEPPAGMSYSAANSDQGRKWMWSLSLPLGGRRGPEFGLMFSISNSRALVKPQRRWCYHRSKLIVSCVPQMWDPEA